VQINLETEQLKLKLIETQLALLQYQHRDIVTNIQTLQAAEAQKKFDNSVDSKDTPSGATTPRDQFSGD
jgi:hypothetical protein